jgi:hypothetical protein
LPRSYPAPPRSYLLKNDGHGHFADVTDSVAPELAQPFGMITAAAWLDFDGDGHVDLVVAGQWMGIEFFRSENGRLRNVTAAMGLPALSGWWYSLAAGDFNHDGNVDLVAGNLGLNQWPASHDAPLGLYASSFTGNNATDLVLTTRQNGKDFPLAGRAMLGQAIYTVGLNFPTYAGYATASVDQLFDPAVLRRAAHYEADTLASLLLENTGHGFHATRLPPEAQIAQLRGIVTTDVDGDGNLDLIVAGNLYDTEPNTPRADAGNGLWLRGDGHGRFTPVSPAESGFLAPLNVTGLGLVKTPTGSAVLVASPGDSLSTYIIHR